MTIEFHQLIKYKMNKANYYFACLLFHIWLRSRVRMIESKEIVVRSGAKVEVFFLSTFVALGRTI